jgi:poly(3-hydroxybutyrate) depolymerase
MLKHHAFFKLALPLALAFGLAANAAAADAGKEAPARLPALAANPGTLTVSGLSSGAFMAVQFEVAHSAEAKGAGVIAGGPYYCARNSGFLAFGECMLFPNLLPQAQAFIDEAQRQGDAHAIDDPENLKQDRIWLWSGGEDHTVPAKTVGLAEAFFRHWVPAAQIAHEQVEGAGHAVVTPDAVDGNACGKTGSPYLNRCRGYDAPGRMLAFVLGRKLEPKAQEASGELLAFDQSEFFPDKESAWLSMAGTGYVYIPKACEKGGCDVHVAFHGCGQNAGSVGEAFVREGGYNRWADSNRLVVLYPQIKKSLVNPMSCWDWWGYTGAGYHLKSAPQIEAVQAMVKRLEEK